MWTDIAWIDAARLGPGRLAVSARPRGGDWLEDEVRHWQRLGVGHVVSLLTPGEVRELELDDESAICRASQVGFTSVPVPDRGLPGSAEQFAAAASELLGRIRAGTGVLVHCRQGIGRASMMATAILAAAGIEPETGLGLVERARGRPVPDTDEQRGWLYTVLPRVGRAA